MMPSKMKGSQVCLPSPVFPSFVRRRGIQQGAPGVIVAVVGCRRRRDHRIPAYDPRRSYLATHDDRCVRSSEIEWCGRKKDACAVCCGG